MKASTEESKYMFMFHQQQNVGQNHDMKIANGCFEKVAEFRYPRTVKECTAGLPTRVAVSALCSVEWGYGGWKPRHLRGNFEASAAIL